MDIRLFVVAIIASFLSFFVSANCTSQLCKAVQWLLNINNKVSRKMPLLILKAQKMELNYFLVKNIFLNPERGPEYFVVLRVIIHFSFSILGQMTSFI